MEKQQTFEYAGHSFTIYYEANDYSGHGSVKEIVTNNDYKLDQFVGISGATFLDIGSNYGVAAIIMGKLNPESTVYAFEPYIKTYEYLVKNVQANGLTNVKTYNLAVTNNSTTSLEITVFDATTGANSTNSDPKTFSKYYRVPTKSHPVECTSLDKIIDENGITRITLLKIDCEGAEFDIIYDSQKFKTGIVKNITGEFHDLPYNKISKGSDDLLKYCRDYVGGMIEVSIMRK